MKTCSAIHEKRYAGLTWQMPASMRRADRRRAVHVAAGDRRGQTVPAVVGHHTYPAEREHMSTRTEMMTSLAALINVDPTLEAGLRQASDVAQYVQAAAESAQRHGYDLDETELQMQLEDLLHQAAGRHPETPELSDRELTDVAGGIMTPEFGVVMACPEVFPTIFPTISPGLLKAWSASLGSKPAVG